MRELLIGHEPVLSDREIIDLHARAMEFLSSPDGNKALREFEVLESMLHGENHYVDNQRTYLAGDYETQPDLFTVTEFGSAVFIVNQRKLFSPQHPFSNLEELKKEIETKIPDFIKKIHSSQKLRVVDGYVASIKNQPIKLFHKRWNSSCDDKTSLYLLKKGWIPLQWNVTAYVVTKDGQRLKATFGYGAYSRSLKQFKNQGIYKDGKWEISSFLITLPESL